MQIGSQLQDPIVTITVLNFVMLFRVRQLLQAKKAAPPPVPMCSA
jgi:hypothetical protein